ncbi:Alpha/Beta hydrolase protein [Microdochium trichocladiopsis]|uniref:Alpha/Beta hydrolase protein n=1 Tax=Microdochium trichocladiopsis TaxID=1682393 RepID=A0A9P8YFP7_9PEZI|nr:Alpha/Beta hydrolase protein [Microdochium trichocladiopsis]KAH7037073.1 Alpha/Beta hydrolase protein [Microdochium trichocladiopsis]
MASSATITPPAQGGDLPLAKLTLPDDQIFTLPDNRGTLSYIVFGDASASPHRTAFFNHGTPGSGLEAAGFDKLCKARRIRVIGVDRPGMGRSSFQPGTGGGGNNTSRRIADWPADILALADHLAIPSFAMIGISGGGPYTYACLAELPRSRLVGACIVASAYPAHLGFEGMMLQNKIVFTVSSWSPWVVEKLFDFAIGRVARDTAHPERLAKMLGDGFNVKADKEAWQTGGRAKTEAGVDPAEFRAFMVEDVRRAVMGGCRGGAWDIYAITTDWGFKLEDVADKVQALAGTDEDKKKLVVWHGAQDVNCPVGWALKVKEVIRDADWRISEADAHFSVTVNHLADVVEVLDRMLAE